jgi:hypothetical protein
LAIPSTGGGLAHVRVPVVQVSDQAADVEMIGGGHGLIAPRGQGWAAGFLG